MQELISIFPEVQNYSVLQGFQKPTHRCFRRRKFCIKVFYFGGHITLCRRTTDFVDSERCRRKRAAAKCCEEWFSPHREVLRLDISKDDSRKGKMQALYCLKSFLENDNKIIVASYTELMSHVPDIDVLKRNH